MTPNFLDKMVRWYKLRADGDELFALFMSLQIFGNILGKNSFINITPTKKRFNLYTTLVGESYFGRKNVTQDMFKNLYPPCRILPNESSAEKFLVNLSRMPNGVWMYGEISKLLKHIHNGGYLSTIVETLNDLHNYEYTTFVKDIMRETVTIVQPYPCFNSTITPEVLKDQVTTEMLEGGFFSKVILVPGKSGESGNRDEIPQEAFELEREIKKVLTPLFDEIMTIEFKLSAEAKIRFSEIEKDAIKSYKVRSAAGRYSEDVVILAGLIAFGEALEAYSNNSNKSIKSKNSNNSNINFTSFIINTIFTIITPQHLDRAYKMIRPCIALVDELYEWSAMNKKYIVKLKKHINEHYPILRSRAMCMCNLDHNEILAAELTLVEHGFLNYFVYQGIKSNGVKMKKQYIYCVMKPDKNKCKDCIYKKECKMELME